MSSSASRAGVSGLLFLALVTLGSGAATAQEMYSDVEYISGHADLTEKQKGTLLIGDSELKFTKKDGTLVFSVPLAGVTEVNNQVEVRDASVGKKLLFGGLAGSRKQDFVQISYETDQLAEGIVFKVKQGTSTGIVAKLKFAVKKKKGAAPAGASGVSPSVAPLQ
ncbi:MAG: hypothetical protein ACJ8BF_14405 [Gemmatimonadales bacterium]